MAAQDYFCELFIIREYTITYLYDGIRGLDVPANTLDLVSLKVFAFADDGTVESSVRYSSNFLE